jgi:sulfotransferase
MNRTFHFISGMPRAGSTLLANLLAQNPRFECSATSGILEVIVSIRNGWDKLDEFRAAPNDAAKLNVLRGILDGFYASTDRPVALDKSRGWIAYMEMAEAILGRKARVLVPVRDIRDILASFETLRRANSALRQTGGEAGHFHDYQSIEGRCETLLRPDQPVGLAYARIRDALLRGFRDRLHFVHFERLTAQPQQTMQEIYQFLGEAPFTHDFQNVKQVTTENDAIYGYADLHTIRPKVEAVPSRAKQILGPAFDRYPGPFVWNQV